MTRWYAFNGDADGLCALQQLRLVEPQDAALVTGVKRDIRLLQRVPAASGEEVTVLDVSLDQNREALTCLLDSGVTVRYFDHHHAGELPRHPRFEPHIDTAAEVCTSILVDRFLAGRHRAWAIAAAFGDGLTAVGEAMARAAGLDSESMATLERLGVYLNYNAYGETVADLHFDPRELAQRMLPFADPLDFVRHSDAYARLASGFAEDMAKARALKPVRQAPGASVVVLPDEAWARRVIGVLANELAQAQSNRAIAILSPKAQGAYTVSVRVPATSPVGADEFCLAFDTGGGRKTAGGINHLPQSDVDRFIARFEACYRTARSAK